MQTPKTKLLTCAAALGLLAPIALAQHQEPMHMPAAKDQPAHQESGYDRDAKTPTKDGVKAPILPEGQTLDEVLDQDEHPPSDRFGPPVLDNDLRVFTIFDQLEFRSQDNGPDQFGWDAQGWIGYDYDKFWWKSQGDVVFQGADEGSAETDLLYSKLVTPFWYAQVGVQYANEWDARSYNDRWSGVIAFQGLVPGKFDVDTSLYISQDADVTLSFEALYDIRLTQRLVLQPRTEMLFSFQEVKNRMLGDGLTDANLDLRLRYEIKREFAPYVGLRYRFLAGETADIAKINGIDDEQFYLILGVRFIF